MRVLRFKFYVDSLEKGALLLVQLYFNHPIGVCIGYFGQEERVAQREVALIVALFERVLLVDLKLHLLVS